MSILATIALGAALFPPDATEATRVARLSPFFTPTPGAPFALEARDRRDYPRQTALKARAFLDVQPPKGTCLTIKVEDDQPDEVVCKRRRIAFTLAQLDRHGGLTWRVSTGEGDVGTDLRWPSPYRIAMVTPWNAKPDDPQVYRFIEACEPSAGEVGRKITLRLLGGEDWIIRFPERDEALPQPDETPNLFIFQSNQKISVTQAAHKDHESKHDTPESEPSQAQPAPKKEGQEAEPRRPKDPNNIEADRKWWAIPLRGSYEMSASYFQPYGSVGPGLQGRCRYIYDSGSDDPGVGRLECHGADGFKSVLLPLACIGKIGPRPR